MSSKQNKKQEKSKSRTWDQCSKCHLSFISSDEQHVCQENLENPENLFDQNNKLFLYKNLAYLNLTEHPKGNQKLKLKKRKIPSHLTKNK